MTKHILPVFIPHVGCPHQCVFCDQKAITGQKAPTGREVERIIKKGLPLGKNPQIAFYGGSFTAIPAALQEEYLEAAFPYVQQGQAQGVRVSTRPDCITEEGLALLKKYGVQTIELGAQSMDDEVLRLSGRGHRSEDTLRAARLVQEKGFELILQLMVGLPGDSREKSLRSARQVAALHPQGVRLYPVCVLCHTPLFAMMERGEYTPLTLEEGVEWSADALEVFQEKGIPVIRLGLNPSRELEEQVAAGVYHPALGQLVQSRILRRQCEEVLRNALPGPVTLYYKKGQRSTLQGQKNENLRYFKEHYPDKIITLEEAESLRSHTALPR